MVVCMEIQHDALDLWCPAVVGDVDFGDAVDRQDARADLVEFLLGDEIRLVQDNHVRVGDLHVRHGENRPRVPGARVLRSVGMARCGFLWRGLVQKTEDVLRVD